MARRAQQVLRMNDEPVGFDQLGRGAQMLATLRAITEFKPPLVVGVYGDWGEGKTSFMRTMQALLSAKERERYAEGEATAKISDDARVSGKVAALLSDKLDCKELLTVWFNPWQHQFEDEPVMPLLDAIRLQHQDRWSKLKSKLKGLVDDPKYRIIGKAALGVVKMAGPGWFSALARQIGDEARQIMDSFAGFQDEFEKCMKELTATQGQRIVIFVDDLDRCEAEYTVRILESLKLHMLNQHCIFVLGCAEQRVRAALMKKLELDETEASEYLEKIVQIPLRLRRPQPEDLKRLLRSLDAGEFADNEECFGLIEALAGHDPNPRRLKRFLHWYRMERWTIDFVPGLAGHPDVKSILEDEPLLMKIKMLQFLRPRQFYEPKHFLRYDTGATTKAARATEDEQQ